MIKQRLVSKKELRALYGIPYSFTHIQRLEDAGRFPKRLRLGNGPRGRVAWFAEHVERWIEERAAASGLGPS